MSSNPKSSKSAVCSEIAKAIGATNFLLPGESQEEYRAGVQSALDELQARTHLQVYVAEKIFQCMWWLRRYELQKQAALCECVVSQITTKITGSEQKLALRKLVYSDSWKSTELQLALTKSGHTTESVLQASFVERQEELMKLDQQIAIRIKTLHQLQQSYEALIKRGVLQERLKIQNDLLKRDLRGTDATPVNRVGQGTK